MNSRILLITYCALFYGIVLGQQSIQWTKNYGGNSEEIGYSVIQTNDGGYIVSGSTDTYNNGDVTGHHGSRDVWVTKFNNSGDLEWQSAYGGSNAEPFTSALTTIIQTQDGGYLITAESNSNDGDLTENKGNYDLWVFKIDNTGNIIWQKSFGGGANEGAFSILEETDGSFILAGYSSSSDGNVVGLKGMLDGWLIRLSSTGDLLWQRTVGGTWTDAFLDINHTSDGGYIASGYTLSNDNDLTGENPHGFYWYKQFWIVKFDSAFDIEWQSVLGGSADDLAVKVFEAPDGGYVVAGNSESSDGDVGSNFGQGDWWIVKLTAAGEIDWKQTVGGSQGDNVASMVACSDNSGFFVTGTTASTDGTVVGNHGGKDIWLVKFDYDGNILSNSCFGGEPSSNDRAFSIIETDDNSLVITGVGYSTPESDEGLRDLLIFKLNPNLLEITELENDDFNVYPNPAVENIYFSEPMKTVEIYTLSGQKLVTKSTTNAVSVKQLSSGAYLLKAKTMNGEWVTKKIMKQ